MRVSWPNAFGLCCKVLPLNGVCGLQAGKISHYELFGSREVVLYWRCMAPAAEAVITFDAVATIAGCYTAPPSRAYLYYTSEHKVWAAPLQIEVSRK